MNKCNIIINSNFLTFNTENDTYCKCKEMIAIIIFYSSKLDKGFARIK